MILPPSVDGCPAAPIWWSALRSLSWGSLFKLRDAPDAITIHTTTQPRIGAGVASEGRQVKFTDGPMMTIGQMGYNQGEARYRAQPSAFDHAGCLT